MLLAFIAGGLFGVVGMAVLSVNTYEKGYEDGKKEGYKDATYQFDKIIRRSKDV